MYRSSPLEISLDLDWCLFGNNNTPVLMTGLWCLLLHSSLVRIILLFDGCIGEDNTPVLMIV